MTGNTKVWPVKSTISPDIVRWPAVISSPGYYLDANAELVSVLGSPIGNVMILKEKKGLYHGQPWKD